MINAAVFANLSHSPILQHATIPDADDDLREELLAKPHAAYRISREGIPDHVLILAGSKPAYLGVAGTDARVLSLHGLFRYRTASSFFDYGSIPDQDASYMSSRGMCLMGVERSPRNPGMNMGPYHDVRDSRGDFATGSFDEYAQRFTDIRFSTPTLGVSNFARTRWLAGPENWHTDALNSDESLALIEGAAFFAPVSYTDLQGIAPLADGRALFLVARNAPSEITGNSARLPYEVFYGPYTEKRGFVRVIGPDESIEVDFDRPPPGITKLLFDPTEAANKRVKIETPSGIVIFDAKQGHDPIVGLIPNSDHPGLVAQADKLKQKDISRRYGEQLRAHRRFLP